MNNTSLFEFDTQISATKGALLCGVDEAGRGPLAGPVVAAAVILPESIQIDDLNDSKKVSEKQRVVLDTRIRTQALSFGIGVADVQTIERINILQATFLAMRRAVDNLSVQPEYVLVDGRDFPGFECNGSSLPGRSLVKGDARSAVVAAASILAKVFRDKLMTQYAAQYPEYGFEKHKGYGTKFHREQILRIGPSALHRKTFLRKILRES